MLVASFGNAAGAIRMRLLLLIYTYVSPAGANVAVSQAGSPNLDRANAPTANLPAASPVNTLGLVALCTIGICPRVSDLTDPTRTEGCPLGRCPRAVTCTKMQEIRHRYHDIYLATGMLQNVMLTALDATPAGYKISRCSSSAHCAH